MPQRPRPPLSRLAAAPPPATACLLPPSRTAVCCSTLDAASPPHLRTLAAALPPHLRSPTHACYSRRAPPLADTPMLPPCRCVTSPFRTSPPHCARLHPPFRRTSAALRRTPATAAAHHRSPPHCSPSPRLCLPSAQHLTSARRPLASALPPHLRSPPHACSCRRLPPQPPSAASPPPLHLPLHACHRRCEPLFTAAPLTPPRRRTCALRRTPATAAVHRRSPPYQCSRLAAASSLRSSPHLRRVRTAPACILPLHLRSLLLQPPLATARRCTHAATRCCVSAPLRTSPPHGARLYPPYHRIPARRSTSACRRTPATAAAGSHTHTAVSPPHPCSRLAAAPSLAVASRLRTAHACGHLATAPGPLLAAAHMQQPRRHTMAAVSQQHLR